MAMLKGKIFNADVLFAFFVGAVLFILLFPLPTSLLSMFLVVNISLSLMLMLIVFYLKKALEISAFPTILLTFTMFRLALNVASTKLILMDANAGSVIDAFGKFVVGNNYIIGAVVFLILVVINFVVIVKGSTRIAEVAARFTLDAMPGKQMSIDSDLNAGIIDDVEAKRRRKEINDEAEFYGAMDGASKFVTGDAVAGIIITVINVLGGIAIGVFQMKMDVVEALQTYTVLTIGDGLVSQIPALLISVSAGMLVAKTSNEEGGTGAHLFAQFLRRHEPLFLSSIMLMVLAILPGFPFVPFAMLSVACFMAGMFVYKHNKAETEELALALAGGQLSDGKGGLLPGGEMSEKEKRKEEDKQLPKISPMTLEIGFSLVPLVDPDQEGDLVDRISLIRRQIKEEMGFLIPPISIQDNIELGNNEYRILVRGLERTRGAIHMGSHLAINPGDVTGQIEGVKTFDPAFGFNAVWINSGRVDAAERMGYTVVDASSVITTHVTKVVKDYAAELLSRQDVSNMLEQVRESSTAVVSELVPGQLSIGVVHRVLQHLLDEKVPIHDMPAILETLSDFSSQTRDPVLLCEFARQSLKGHIVSRHLGDDHTLYSMTLDPMLEDEIQKSVSNGSGGGILSLQPEKAFEITEKIKNVYEKLSSQIDYDIVLLVSPLIRLHVSRMVQRKIHDLPVLSYAEVSDDIPLKVLASVSVKNERLAAA
ncbi:MAG: flagellar biosynthesis protein FlhA [Lentisphaerae bacterium GWF2_45_14]|nr:MAG: flagellar biosynthesis protein FlhA [Lentisphaerae bacterium GWF2_45_14]